MYQTNLIQRLKQRREELGVTQDQLAELAAVGDAHLKNFSLLENRLGILMSPAYDLVNTCLHVDDTDFAFSKKLFADDYHSPAWKKSRHGPT